MFGDSLLKCEEPRLEAGRRQDVSPLCRTGPREAGAKCWVRSQGGREEARPQVDSREGRGQEWRNRTSTYHLSSS